MFFGRCLVTGGTGWLGRYIVAALEHAGNEVVAPRRGEFVNGRFGAVIHGAPIDVQPYRDLAIDGDAPILLLSSGAVREKPDAYLGGYARIKREMEAACAGYGKTRTARIFSVLGPGIPLVAHYAASSFLSQALAGGPVVVKDGAIRSYLHPKDLAAALLTILAHGDGEPYDVGGEERITVADLGRRIAAHAGVACHLAEPLPSDVYLPDLTRLHALGWKQTISTDEAITDTLESLRVRA